MFRARDIVNAVECCTGDETMGQLLPYLLEQLETCQKSLTGYLGTYILILPLHIIMDLEIHDIHLQNRNDYVSQDFSLYPIQYYLKFWARVQIHNPYNIICSVYLMLSQA